MPQNFLNLLIIVTIFVTLAGTIYVPETARNYNQLNAIGIKENKLLTRDLTEKEHKYLIKLKNNDDDDERNDVQQQQQSLFTAHQAKSYNNVAHQLLPIPTQQKSYDINDDVAISAKNRTSYNDEHEQRHENLEAQPKTTGLAEQQQHQQQHLLYNNDVLKMEKEEDFDDFDTTLQHSRQKRQLSDFLIAPNTRWCGRGNTANGTYNHLGGASMADKCCRTHDHCKLYIPGMSNRFDLFNYRPYTLSHCNCDRRFRTCLKMANDEDANTIGKLFFNLVQTQCFVLAKEVVCQQRAKDGTCLKEHVKQKAYLRNNKKY